MRFVTHYNFCDLPKKEYLADITDIVETAGYVDKEKMIFSMINAGLRLQEVRKHEFDGENSEEALENFDVTRSGDFDIVDAGVMLSELQNIERANKAGTVVGNTLSVNSDKSATFAESTSEARE